MLNCNYSFYHFQFKHNLSTETSRQEQEGKISILHAWCEGMELQSSPRIPLFLLYHNNSPVIHFPEHIYLFSNRSYEKTDLIYKNKLLIFLLAVRHVIEKASSPLCSDARDDSYNQ